MRACLVLGLGTCLVLVGTITAADDGTAADAAADDGNGTAADAARPSRIRREIENDPSEILMAAMLAAMQQIVNSPPPAPRFAAQLGVAEQQWLEDCADYPSKLHTHA